MKAVVLTLVAPLLAGLGLGSARGHDEEGLAPDVPFRKVGELTFLKSGDPLLDWKSRRAWTSTDGRTLQAKILGVKDGQVALQLENGKTTPVPIDRLIEDDRRFISEWEAVSEYFNLGYEPIRTVTDTIEAGIFDGAFAKEGKVHETRNFRFECDAVLNQEVVKDFSRLFEVTYLGVLANPLGLAIAKPIEGKFVVKLFASKNDYLSAGGSEDAAGVYMIKDRVMLVPLRSLGLTAGSGGYRKTADFDPRTLIHETTHALTHQWLAHAPMWFVEGFAEYIAAIPYEDGRLYLSKHRAGLADLATKKFGGDAKRFPLSEPADFTKIGHRTFMGEPEATEPVIELPQVKPFQITLVSNTEATADGSGDEAGAPESETPAPDTDSPNSNLPKKPNLTGGLIPTGIAPIGRPPTSSDGREVVVRYVSSMTLLHYLFSTGQTDALRRYLFDFTRFEWDLNNYLTNYESTHKDHRAAVEKQIREFEDVLKQFNADIDNYNTDVDRFKSGATETRPTVPKEPVAPGPLPVPGILADPRQPESLSRQTFLENAWDRHLRFQGDLSVGLFEATP